jgi:hypothetical protein
MTPKFYGTIKYSRFHFSIGEQARYEKYIATIKPDVPLELVVKVKRVKRSNSQNAYYWFIIDLLIRESAMQGYTKDEAHGAMKLLFLSVNKGDGKPPTVRSTTALNTKEFTDYIEAIKGWARDFLEIEIPSPDRVDLSEYGRIYG